MRYLVVDACLGSTGIRDYYEGGSVSPNDLNLNSETILRITNWMSRYENAHYEGFKNSIVVDELDEEGRAIALVIKKELGDVKVDYFSDARMTKTII